MLFFVSRRCCVRCVGAGDVPVFKLPPLYDCEAELTRCGLSGSEVELVLKLVRDRWSVGMPGPEKTNLLPVRVLHVSLLHHQPTPPTPPSTSLRPLRERTRFLHDKFKFGANKRFTGICISRGGCRCRCGRGGGGVRPQTSRQPKNSPLVFIIHYRSSKPEFWRQCLLVLKGSVRRKNATFWSTFSKSVL